MMQELLPLTFKSPRHVSPVAFPSMQFEGLNAMTKTDGKFHRVSRETVAHRWRDFLRDHYPRNAAKSVMRDFDCEQSTANSWLQGRQRPQLDNFIRAAELFGISAVLGVLWPNTEEHHRSKLHDDLRELRSRLDGLSRVLGGTPDEEKNKPDRGGNRG